MIAIDIPSLLFYANAVLLLGSALMVIRVKHPVRSVLFLVLCFIASASLWLLMEAEFLALVLIFVYVGAVMTLFLFVVMMLNINQLPQKPIIKWFFPFIVALMAVFFVLLSMGISHIITSDIPLPSQETVSNTAALGAVLYTQYALPLQIAGLLLVTSVIAAVVLTFTGKKPGTLYQEISKQHAADPKKRLRLVDPKPGDST